MYVADTATVVVLRYTGTRRPDAGGGTHEKREGWAGKDSLSTVEECKDWIEMGLS